MEYTFGKWEMTKRSDGEIHVVAIEREGMAYFVANCGHQGNEILPCNENAIDNAKLISAAPDMYEILQDILNDNTILGLPYLRIHEALYKIEGK
jgi:hypothetical protein